MECVVNRLHGFPAKDCAAKCRAVPSLFESKVVTLPQSSSKQIPRKREMDFSYYNGLDPWAICLASGHPLPSRPSRMDSGYLAEKWIGPVADSSLAGVFQGHIDQEVEKLRVSYPTGCWLSRYFARIGFVDDDSTFVYILLIVREGSMTTEQAQELVGQIESICENFGCRNKLFAEVAAKPATVPRATLFPKRLDNSYLQTEDSLKLGCSVGHTSTAGSSSVVVDGVHANGVKTRCLLISGHVAFTKDRPCQYGHRSNPTQEYPDKAFVYEDGKHARYDVYLPAPIDLDETICWHEKEFRGKGSQDELEFVCLWTQKKHAQRPFGYVLACSGYKQTPGAWAVDWALVKPDSLDFKEVNKFDPPQPHMTHRLYDRGLFTPPTRLAAPPYFTSVQDSPKVLCKIGRTTNWTAGLFGGHDVIIYQGHVTRAQYITCKPGKGAFSKKGDSGSLVFDGKGTPQSYIIAGKDPTQVLDDITYAIPFDVIEEDIKRTMDWARLDIVGLYDA